MKKSLHYLSMVALALTGLTGCSESTTDPNSLIEYYPIREESRGRWGLLGSNGEILISEEFKSAPTPVVNGLFSVRETDGYALYKAGKKPVYVPGCEELKYVGVMMEGVIPVTKKNERISLVNDKGKNVATLMPVNNKEIIACAPMITEGRLIAWNEDGDCGVLDRDGKVVVDFKYKGIEKYAEGLALATKVVGDDETKIVILDKDGKEVATVKGDIRPITGKFKYGYVAAVDKDGRYGFIDKKGEFNRLPGKVEGITDYNSKYFVFLKDGERGIMTMDLEDPEVVVSAKYGSISIIKGDKFLVSDDGNYFVIDTDGDKTVKFEDYKSISYVNAKGFTFIAREGSHYVLLDDNGEQVNKKQEFNEIDYSLPQSTIHTDYFNLDGLVQDMVDMLTDKGIGPYRIGEPASQLGLNLDDCPSYSYNFNNDNLNKSGYRYSITFNGRTTRYIKIWDYDSDSRYVINPEARVEYLGIVASAEKPVWPDIRTKLIDAIKAKGYKIDEEKEYYITFTKGNVTLALGSEYSRVAIVLSERIQEEAPAEVPAAEEAWIEEAPAAEEAPAY